ncbi:MAG: hypothetical protein P1P69_05000 [Methanosarcinaceae archaeon]|nr:hypothetical protein [Methanosarcinaceae archaeon]MDF1533845.1 hypothetical protein [Methanosarcinaceae archaeon]
MICLKGSTDHLTGYFLKPCEGEEIPINFIDLEDKIAGWSPELKRTLYVEDIEDTEELKRVRDVTLLKVYNWLGDGESVIELSDPERMQFEDVMNEFVKTGGEIRYTRKKINGKMVNMFRLEKGTPVKRNVKERLLSDLL